MTDDTEKAIAQIKTARRRVNSVACFIEPHFPLIHHLRSNGVYLKEIHKLLREQYGIKCGLTTLWVNYQNYVASLKSSDAPTSHEVSNQAAQPALRTPAEANQNTAASLKSTIPAMSQVETVSHSALEKFSFNPTPDKDALI